MARGAKAELVSGTPDGGFDDRQLRGLLRLFGETGEIAGVSERRTHLVRGLRAITGAAHAALVFDEDFGPGRTSRTVDFVLDGLEMDAATMKLFESYFVEGRAFDPGLARLMSLSN